MSFKKASLVAVLAVSMAGTPVLAQTANSASSLSVAAASQRAGAEMDDANELRGWLIPVIAVVAIILGVLAATGGGGDAPTSP